MPEYVPYYGLPMLLRKIEKMTGEKYPASYDNYLKFAFDNYLRKRDADLFTLAMEASHYLMSHHVLIVTKGLAEMILRSRISVNLDHLRLPFGTFEVCFDKEMKIPDTDTPVPSVLCTFLSEQSTQDFFIKFTKDMFAKYNMPNARPFPPSKELIAFRMADPRQSKEIDGTRETLLFNLRRDYAKDKEIEQVVAEGPVLETVDEALNKEETDIVRVGTKLALGAICYLNMERRQAEPFKDRNRPRMGNPPQILLLGKRCISATFMRKGHMRTLLHPRFKRIDGYPQIIWVREHIVNPQGAPEEKDPKITEVEEEEIV